MIVHFKRFLATNLIALFAFCANPALAFAPPDGYSLAVGTGEPNNLRGLRAAAQWHWPGCWLCEHYFALTGYWDASLALWETDGNSDSEHRALAAVAVAPMFRFQGTTRLADHYSPYFQASVGLAVLTRNRLGRRDLGKLWQFQDFLGAGVQFGHNLQWDIGLTYLHYSNAGINPPNQGIDVKLMLMLQYHFPTTAPLRYTAWDEGMEDYPYPS